jgi:lipopolysaccharide cholinephosphotransferase
MELHDVSKSSSYSGESVLSDKQLKKLQELSLMILDDVIYICKENNIEFLLIGGSAIGALRNKGFIPWDDDIDIAMTRENYEVFHDKFSCEFSEKYLITDSRDKKNYGRVIPKIRIKGTTYRTILEHDLGECGIRMDIFIIENTYNNKVLRYIHGILSLFFGFALSCRRLYMWRKEFSKLYNGMSFKIKKIFGFVFSFTSIDKWARWTDYWYSKCKDNKSEYVTLPSDVKHFFGEIEKRRDICNGHIVEYEHRNVKVPLKYDEYLKKRYGDYMQEPSENDRIRSKYIEYDAGIYS